VNTTDAKTRKAIANEINRAASLYEEEMGSHYAGYFRDASKVVELGFDEWARQFEDSEL